MAGYLSPSIGVCCFLVLLVKAIYTAAFAPLVTPEGEYSAAHSTLYNDCGGVISSVSGNVTSPGFPDHIPAHYIECDWVIKVLSGQKVMLKFLYFDLPGASYDGMCTRSFVAYGEFDDKGRKVVQARVCGNVRPNIFVSRKSWLWVQFVTTGRFSERNTAFSGFDAYYSMHGSEVEWMNLVIGVSIFIIIPIACCVPFCRVIGKLHEEENRAMEYSYLDKIHGKIKTIERLREIRQLQAERARSVNIDISDREKDVETKSESPGTKPKPPVKPRLSKRASLRRRLLMRNISQSKSKESKKDKSYIPASPNVSYSGAYVAQYTHDTREVVDPSTPITRILVQASGEQKGEFIYLPVSVEPQTLVSPGMLQAPSQMPSISQTVDIQKVKTPRVKVGSRSRPTGTSPSNVYLTEGTPGAESFQSPVYIQAEGWSPDVQTRMEDPYLEEKVSPIYGPVKSRYKITPENDPPLPDELDPYEANADGNLSYAMDYNENVFSHPPQEMPVRPGLRSTKDSMFYSLSDYGSELASGGSSTYPPDPRHTLTYDVTADTVRRFAIGTSESTLTSSAMSRQESTLMRTRINNEYSSHLSSNRQVELLTHEQPFLLTSDQQTAKSHLKSTSPSADDTDGQTDLSLEMKQPALDNTIGTLSHVSPEEERRKLSPIPRYPMTMYSPEQQLPWPLTPTTPQRYPPPHKLSPHVRPYPTERHIQVALFKHDKTSPESSEENSPTRFEPSPDEKTGKSTEFDSSGMSDRKTGLEEQLEETSEDENNDISLSQFDEAVAVLSPNTVGESYIGTTADIDSNQSIVESHLHSLYLPGYKCQGLSASKGKAKKSIVSSPLTQILPSLSKSAPNLSSPPTEIFMRRRPRHNSARVGYFDSCFFQDESGNVTLSLPEGLPHRETLV